MIKLLTALIRQFARLWHAALPASCLWCSLPVQRFDRQLCAHCQQALPQLPYPHCHYNLLWLPHVSRGLSKTRFDQLLSVGFYQQPYRHWLQRWKFAADAAAGDLLLQQFDLMLQQYQQDRQPLPQALLYAPMHPPRQRQRGFNQAQLLAEVAAARLNIPLLHAFSRNTSVPAQVGLNRKQRQRNLRQAFTLQAGILLPARVALVDDVVTTGATANELCRLLRRAGVREISLWTVAVTLNN
ncbi:ComF family protein [Rheinheimera fenheensis]|uniref:ComF family protein n=1 Tax=Rheinheimera fenheensis TaxID=3152295 RepID=UPI0032601D94